MGTGTGCAYAGAVYCDGTVGGHEGGVYPPADVLQTSMFSGPSWLLVMFANCYCVVKNAALNFLISSATSEMLF